MTCTNNNCDANMEEYYTDTLVMSLYKYLPLEKLRSQYTLALKDVLFIYSTNPKLISPYISSMLIYKTMAVDKIT